MGHKGHLCAKIDQNYLIRPKAFSNTDQRSSSFSNKRNSDSGHIQPQCRGTCIGMFVHFLVEKAQAIFEKSPKNVIFDQNCKNHDFLRGWTPKIKPFLDDIGPF